MNIWVINQDADTPEGDGSTRSYDISVALAEKGHQVTLILGNFSDVRRQHIEEPTHLIHQQNMMGIRLIRLPTIAYTQNNWKRFASALIFSLGLLTRNLGKDNPDIIIGSSPNPIAAFGAYLLAKKTKSQFFYEIIDLWPVTLTLFNKFSKNHPVIILFKVIEKKLSMKSKTIIAVPPWAGDYLTEKYQIPRAKILYLPNSGATVDTMIDQGYLNIF